MNSDSLTYTALRYVSGSNEFIEPTLTALSEPFPETYPLNPPPEGDFAKPTASHKLKRIENDSIIINQFVELTLI